MNYCEFSLKKHDPSRDYGKIAFVMTNDSTKVDRWIEGMKNHPWIAAIILVAIIVIALAKFTEAVEKLSSFFSFLSAPGEVISTEEQERVKATTPYLKEAYAERLNTARNDYTDHSYIHVEDKILMCGSRPTCIGGYSVEQLRQAEAKASASLQPLAHFYNVLGNCVANDICSARVAYHDLCVDATEKYRGIVAIREHVVERMRLEGIGEYDLDSKRKEMERDNRVIHGLRSFSEGCLEWNRNNPDNQATIVDKPFITYR